MRYTPAVLIIAAALLTLFVFELGKATGKNQERKALWSEQGCEARLRKLQTQVVQLEAQLDACQ